jgi:hypothetical protein
MIEKLVLPIVLGVISSLMANWLTATWSTLSSLNRWLISVAVGIITMIAVAVVINASKRKPMSSTTNVLSDITSGGKIQAKDVEANVSNSDGDLNVLSHNNSKSDFTAENVKVRRGELPND